MREEGHKTAADLIAELQNDPEYLRRRRERDEKTVERSQKYSELERPILQELRGIGIVADSIRDVVAKYSPLSDQIVAILLRSISTSQDERHLETLVRSLGAASSAFDGTLLAQCHDRTSDESLRWAIANTIALARPHSIDDWIRKSPDDSALRSSLVKLGYFS